MLTGCDRNCAMGPAGTTPSCWCWRGWDLRNDEVSRLVPQLAEQQLHDPGRSHHAGKRKSSWTAGQGPSPRPFFFANAEKIRC